MVADACVAVKGSRQVPVGFTLWLGLDDAGAPFAEGVESASGDAVSGEDAQAGEGVVADAAQWTLSAGGETVASLEWNGSKFSRDKAVSAGVRYVKSTGAFSGSYKVSTVQANGRKKTSTVKFEGVFVDGVGYGTAGKGTVAMPVVLAPVSAV